MALETLLRSTILAKTNTRHHFNFIAVFILQSHHYEASEFEVKSGLKCADNNC